MKLYAIEAPIAHVKEAFTGMSQFTTGIRQIFEGSMQWSDTLPCIILLNLF